MLLLVLAGGEIPAGWTRLGTGFVLRVWSSPELTAVAFNGRAHAALGVLPACPPNVFRPRLSPTQFRIPDPWVLTQLCRCPLLLTRSPLDGGSLGGSPEQRLGSCNISYHPLLTKATCPSDLAHVSPAHPSPRRCACQPMLPPGSLPCAGRHGMGGICQHKPEGVWVSGAWETRARG